MQEHMFKWAFIGAGGIAHSVARRITACGRHRITAVYNRTFERGKKLADKYGAKAYKSLEDAVNASDVDGVYVNVTNNVHYDYCARAIRCGKPVLLEKPFTTDAEQAAELFALAKENNVYLSEAMWTWFSDSARAAKEVTDSRAGSVKNALITLCLPIAFGKKSRLLKSELAGGALLDVGVYPITYAYRLFGKPNGIDAKARFKFGVDVDDDITFKYDGFDVKIKASVRGLRGVGERIEIVGDGWTLKGGKYHEGKSLVYRHDGITERTAGDNNAMLTQFDRVAAEIRDGRTESAYVPHGATADVMELLDNIREIIGLKFTFENR